MKLTPSTTLAAFVLIGAGGFFAGRVSSSKSQQTALAPLAESRSSSASSRNSSAGEESNRLTRPGKAVRNSQGMTPDRLKRLESIVRGENALDRNRALLAFIDQLGPNDFAQAVNSFRALDITETRMGEYSLLLTAWAEMNPLSALYFTRDNTNASFATNTILTSWATRDPEAAIRWAQAEHQSEGPNPYLAGIIRGLAETDPTRATDLMTSLPRSTERAEALNYFIPHLLKQGPDATRSWIATIADESLRNGAIVRSARQLADADPAATASWLLENPGEASDRRLDDVYRVWAKKDSQAALAALNALPPGDNRSNALKGMVSGITVENPKEALDLMNQYSADLTDRVVQNFIWYSYDSEPSIAASQIARITNERDRDRMYRRLLDNWMERDPSTAQTWIQTNSLPQSITEHLTERAEKSK